MPLCDGDDGFSKTVSDKWNGLKAKQKYGNGYLCFIGFFVVGVLFILFSLFMIPFIVVFPGRVAGNFNIGALLIMIAFAIQRGWKEFFVDELLCGEQPKKTLAIAFVVAMVLTIYMAFFAESYIGTLIFFVLEVIVLAYFIGSFFPGGAEGVHDFFKTIGSGLKRAFCSCCDK